MLYFSTLSQGLEDDIMESSIGRWADTVATYCPGRPSQIVLKSLTKHHNQGIRFLITTDKKKRYVELGAFKLAHQQMYPSSYFHPHMHTEPFNIHYNKSLKASNILNSLHNELFLVRSQNLARSHHSCHKKSLTAVRITI